MKLALGILIGICIVALGIGAWVVKKALIVSWIGIVFGAKALVVIAIIVLIGWVWHKIRK